MSSPFFFQSYVTLACALQSLQLGSSMGLLKPQNDIIIPFVFFVIMFGFSVSLSPENPNENGRQFFFLVSSNLVAIALDFHHI